APRSQAVANCARHLTEALLAVRGSSAGGTIELRELQHGAERAVRSLWVRIDEKLAEPRRNHLPGNTEFVLQPSASLRSGIAALTELCPVVVHLFLRLAFDLQ